MRFLFYLAIIVAIVWLVRRVLRGRSAPPPVVDATPAPAALPAPATSQAASRIRFGPLAESSDGARSATQSRSALHSLLLGVPEVDPEVPVAHARFINDVLAALEDASNEPKYMPRRPLLIPELMRLVADPDASRRQMSALVARDPALAADVLRMANSALYRSGPGAVESIDRAVAVLGTDGMRSAIAAALLQPVFRTPAGAFARFPALIWDHAFISGVAAESCAALLENEDPFAAQLLALLTGLGHIVVFRATTEHYAAQTELAPDASAVARLLDLQGAAIARRIAAEWDVSDRMLMALSDQLAATRGMSDQLSPLGRAVLLGGRIGTLVLLHREGRLDAEAARSAAVVQGAPRAFIDRLWPRLTQTVD
ncbi:MAG: HDOD domain-containing protein [Steroidobacteraceae bacterium]